MTYQAAIALGVDLRLLANRPDDGAALVASDVAIGAPDSPALETFVAANDVTTFDHELVPAARLAALEAAGHCLRPNAATFALVQNKRRQRAELGAAGFPVPPYRFIAAAADISEFAEMHGWPVVVKAGRGGYDGRGVWVVADATAARDLVAGWETAGQVNALEPLVEAWVPIEREVAVLVARRPGGEAVAYPTVETVQRDGICHELMAPAPIAPELAREAERMALAIAERVDVVGLLAVELFVAGGRLVLNELAARPHNSGHYTIEGCVTSQFEQHLRAVLDWPLGETNLVAPAVATVNVLGGRDGSDPRERLPGALAVPGAHVHLYGKAARPGRKLGHVTVVGADAADVRARARRAAAILSGAEEETS